MELFFRALGEAALLLVDPRILIVVFAGTLWGAAAGALPGLTSVLAIGVMIPFTFGMNPVTAVMFLVAINVGASYGNSVPAILVGVPGSPSAVLTALDGYALHKRGESGLALGITYFSSVAGQFLSIFVFAATVVPLAQLTYVFLAPEMFALYFLGMTALVSVSGKNIVKGLLAAVFGVGISLVGRDPVSSVSRLDFGVPQLAQGLETVPVVLGLLAVSELLRSMRQVYSWDALAGDFRTKFPRLSELRQTVRPMFLGTIIGSIVGAIPGLGGTPAAIISYQQARLTSKTPEQFGNGSIEGIAANEAGQNAAQAGEMVPTFGLGIPGSGAMVLLLGALSMHGLIPGPLLIRETPELLYAAIGGLLAGTLVLAVVGWPIARGLLKIVTLDRGTVLSVALMLTITGVYVMNRSLFDVGVLLLFGGIGYFMLRYGYSTAAAALAAILGRTTEIKLREGLLLVDSSLWAFVTRPWTGAILMLSAALLVYGFVSSVKLNRGQDAAPAPSPGEDLREQRSR